MADATEPPEPAPRPPQAAGATDATDDAGASRTADATKSQEATVERPQFLIKFPDHPELQRLVRAFERGNYAEVRENAPPLLDSENPAVRRAARELLQRIDPDPLMKYLLLLAISLFVLVVWYTYGNRAH